MKTIIIIPARMASQRFPNKPMALIDGIPMIQRVWEKAKLANIGDIRVVVSRSSENSGKRVTYRITFKNAPYNLPQFTVVQNDVLNAPTASQQVEIQTITATTGKFSMTLCSQ